LGRQLAPRAGGGPALTEAVWQKFHAPEPVLNRCAAYPGMMDAASNRKPIRNFGDRLPGKSRGELK
jgi:hypothetical protein